MEFAASDLTVDQTYKLMTGLIVPRPIAWVTSCAPDGQVNLAPFSAFTFLSTVPPIIGISVTLRGGKPKDTAHNIAATGAFVVHVANMDLLESVHASSTEFPPDVSEPEALGLELAPSRAVVVPRIASAPAAMECRLERVVEFGDQGAQLIAGRIVQFHVRNDLLDDGKIPTERLHPIARIAGPRYAPIGPVIEMLPLHEGARRYATGSVRTKTTSPPSRADEESHVP